MAVPLWLDQTEKTALGIDSRPVGGTVYAVYHEGAVTINTLSQHLIDCDIEVFFFVSGSTRPLRVGEALEAMMGGLVQVRPRGSLPVWSDAIIARLGNMDRWNPTVNPPSVCPGLFSVYQSAEDQVIQEIQRARPRKSRKTVAISASLSSSPERTATCS